MSRGRGEGGACTNMLMALNPLCWAGMIANEIFIFISRSAS